MNNATLRAGVKAMVDVNRCSATVGTTGKACGTKCAGPVCGTHKRAHARENPTDKLVPVDNPDTAAVLRILDTMRASPEIVNDAFLDMFISREIFNPAENVNKFVTGGVAEDVLTELIQRIGFPTENVAATKTVIDIEVKVDDRTVGISLKNSGGLAQQPILENYRGESKSEIRELPPTLIVYTETKSKRARIVYLDHAVLKQLYPDLDTKAFNATVYNKKEEGDKQSSLSFKSGFLATLIPKLPDSYIVNAVFPERIPKVPKKSITLLALEYVRQAKKDASAPETQVPTASENEFT